MPVQSPASPLLTLREAQLLETARRTGLQRVESSLDLQKSTSQVDIGPDDWGWQDRRFPYTGNCKERTIYWWSGTGFEPAARYAGALFKLVPTDWGPPTFEIDGIKMLPTAKVSPFDDARRKVELIAPRGKRVLDCCGGLGYFAHWCLQLQAAQVLSFEKNENVLWLRSLNPWSPRGHAHLALRQADVAQEITALPARSVEAILHDPPRFGIAGELYSLDFYEQLARVLTPNGLLFHYTGTPNKLTSGRDVPNEVRKRLEKAGFEARLEGDGVLARRARTARR
jgi:predicted methyltransferase